MHRESPQTLTIITGLYFLPALGFGIRSAPSSLLLIRGLFFLFILISTQWMLFRWAKLLFPRQKQGALLATGILFLNPLFIALPWYGEKESIFIALTAAVFLIGSKIRLRDGLKPPSVLLLGLLSGIGLSISPFFLSTLPWTLPSLWAAARSRRQALGWTGGAALLAVTAFIFGYHASWIRFPSRNLDLSVPYPWNRIIVPPVDTPPIFLTTHLAVFLGIIFTVFFFLHLRILSPRQPAMFIRTAFLGSLVIALATVFLQKVDSTFFFSVWPNLFVLLTWGCTNLTDRLRRYRRVPNTLAEHPAAWGAGLLLLANSCWLWLSR